MNGLISFLIILVIFAAQQYLSTRDKVYLGAVIPVLYFGTLVYAQWSGLVEWSALKLGLYIIIGELFLVGYWISGRKMAANKREKELARMKALDL